MTRDVTFMTKRYALSLTLYRIPTDTHRHSATLSGHGSQRGRWRKRTGLILDGHTSQLTDEISRTHPDATCHRRDIARRRAGLLAGRTPREKTSGSGRPTSQVAAPQHQTHAARTGTHTAPSTTPTDTRGPEHAAANVLTFSPCASRLVETSLSSLAGGRPHGAHGGSLSVARQKGAKTPRCHAGPVWLAAAAGWLILCTSAAAWAAWPRRASLLLLLSALGPSTALRAPPCIGVQQQMLGKRGGCAPRALIRWAICASGAPRASRPRGWRC